MRTLSFCFFLGLSTTVGSFFGFLTWQRGRFFNFWFVPFTRHVATELSRWPSRVCVDFSAVRFFKDAGSLRLTLCFSLIRGVTSVLASSSISSSLTPPARPHPEVRLGLFQITSKFPVNAACRPALSASRNVSSLRTRALRV